MEEVFLQLRGEVARLRELCSEQGRLLRRLRARKGPAPDIPVSLPIQCTEDVTGDGRRSPESRQKPPGAPTSSPPPLGQPQDTTRLPPSPGDGVGAGAAAALGSTEGEEGDVPAWMRPWILPVPWEGGGGGGAPCSPRESEMLNLGAGGSFPNLLDLLEAPAVLEKEDAARAVFLPGEALVEVRGPVKTCWTPGWALEEEALGTGPTRGAAAAWELCQENSPLEAAGHTEYLNHLLAHLE